MMERAIARPAGRPIDRNERDPERAMEERELAAFFRELGLGWDYDPEGLIDRLAASRGER